MEDKQNNQEINPTNEVHIASEEENLTPEKNVEHNHVGEFLEKTEEHKESSIEDEHSILGGVGMIAITIVVLVLIFGAVVYFL